MVADTGVAAAAGGAPRRLFAGHGHGAVVADGPVQDQRHGLVTRHARQVGRPEGVAALLHDEGVVTGAVLLVDVRPAVIVIPHGHGVVGEARRDVDVAAADAGARAVARVPRVVAVGHAPGVVGVSVAAALPVAGFVVDEGVATEDEELVLGVGDTVYAPWVEVDLTGETPGAGSVRAETLPRHRQQHPGLRPRRYRQVQHLDGTVVRRCQHRHVAGAAVVDA